MSLIINLYISCKTQFCTQFCSVKLVKFCITIISPCKKLIRFFEFRPLSADGLQLTFFNCMHQNSITLIIETTTEISEQSNLS